MQHHATVITWNNIGMIFVGPPGSGKSTLAFELIEQGATLVADDQVILQQKNNQWYASCPETIKNKLHLDGVGLLQIEAASDTKVDLIFQSDLPAHPLSQPPDINLPVITIDFKVADAKQFVVKYLSLFDSQSIIP